MSSSSSEFPVFPALPPGWESWEALMLEALDQANLAKNLGEVPVGAVIAAQDGRLIGRGHNAPITDNDPTAHAEIAAIRQAAMAIGNYRLPGCVLVVTLEPCLMCLGAAVHARMSGIVYGAPDPKSGAVESCLQGPALPFLNHRLTCLGGVKPEQCGGLLSDFFKQRRKIVT